MGKGVGLAGLFLGIIIFLYDWVMGQKIRRSRLEELIVFLQKSIFSMEEEKIRMIDHFEGYQSRDEVLVETLGEIASRLKKHIYPNGQMVWEEVFREKKEQWNYEEETFYIILAMGNGFFGNKRSENLCFLKKSLKQLEMQRDRQKDKDAQERKVWIPVGMLGGIMLMIVLI